MADVEQFVEKLINENKIVVFSKSYCRKCDHIDPSMRENQAVPNGVTAAYCRRAKQLLQQLGEKFYIIELDEVGEFPSFTT